MTNRLNPLEAASNIKQKPANRFLRVALVRIKAVIFSRQDFNGFNDHSISYELY